jgi:nucleotide-binding universal stress UspA family protein
MIPKRSIVAAGLESVQDLVASLGPAGDAERTCAAVRPYLEDESELVALYVVEKRGGAPEVASTEQLEEHGRATLAVVEEAFADSPVAVETALRYGTDLVETLFEAADDVDADCIAFVPRPKGRLVALLSGDPGWKLVNRTERPVLVLPRPPEPDETNG